MNEVITYAHVDISHVPSGRPKIDFVKALVPIGKFKGPVALIKYKFLGVEQHQALQLDLTNGVFLDVFLERYGARINEDVPRIIEAIQDALASVQVPHWQDFQILLTCKGGSSHKPYCGKEFIANLLSMRTVYDYSKCGQMTIPVAQCSHCKQWSIVPDRLLRSNVAVDVMFALSSMHVPDTDGVTGQDL